MKDTEVVLGGHEEGGDGRRLVPVSIRKNMSSDHTIWCDHTISKKWTFVHT
jgi:hypothetical protein